MLMLCIHLKYSSIKLFVKIFAERHDKWALPAALKSIQARFTNHIGFQSGSQIRIGQNDGNQAHTAIYSSDVKCVCVDVSMICTNIHDIPNHIHS